MKLFTRIACLVGSSAFCLSLANFIVSCKPKSKLVDISNLIKNKNLGYVKDSNDATLRSLINQKNNLRLTSNDLTFSNKTLSECTVNGIGKYIGQIIINFGIQENIETIISNKNFGNISDNNDSTLINYINYTYQTSFTTNDLKFQNKTQSGCKIIGVNKYQGEINVTYTITTNIQRLISVKNLGYVNDKNDATLLSAINSVNGINLLSSQVEFQNINDTSCKVVGKGTYVGSVDVTFILKVDINTIITIKQLGEINDNTNATLLTAINNVNSASLTLQDIDITYKSTLTATINGINAYKNSVSVSFTIKGVVVTPEQFINLRTFSIGGLSGSYFTRGTGWIINKATQNKNDYIYWIATNMHVTYNGHSSQWKWWSKDLSNQSVYSNYRLFAQATWQPDTDFVFTPNVPNDAIDLSIAKVEFSQSSINNTTIKDNLNYLNDYWDTHNHHINSFVKNYEATDYTNFKMVGGYPADQSSNPQTVSWQTQKVVTSTGYGHVNNYNTDNWYHSISGDFTYTDYIDCSPQYHFQGYDVADMNQFMGGGASGSMVINKNSEICGIYWGKWHTQGTNIYYPSASIFNSDNKNFLASYM